MHFDLQTLAPRDRYKLLTGTVVPRPIALVTSVNENGVVNAAPFSFFNAMGSDPPLVVLGIANRDEHTPKDSARNIRERGEFVVNMVSDDMIGAMNICAVDFPEGQSEVEAAQLQLTPSQMISVPRLTASPAAFECREHSVLHIGRNRIIIGEVLSVFLRDEFVDAEKLYVDTESLRLVGRMGGGGGYVHTSDTFQLARMNFEEWQKRGE